MGGLVGAWACPSVFVCACLCVCVSVCVCVCVVSVFDFSEACMSGCASDCVREGEGQ